MSITTITMDKLSAEIDKHLGITKRAWNHEFTHEQIAHLKGFAGQIDYVKDNEKLRKTFVEEAARYPVLVWDGDGYNDDSFTAMIPEIAAKSSNILWVAFRQAHEEKEFKDSWQDKKVNILLVLTPWVDYRKLGVIAIMSTGARTVLCFGGGATTLGEYQYLNLPLENPAGDDIKPTTFKVFPATRPNAKGNPGRETAALIKRAEASGTRLEVWKA